MHRIITGLLMALAATAGGLAARPAIATTPETIKAAPADRALQNYIVTFAEPGLMHYEGGIRGLAPTALSAAGHRPDVHSPESQAYLAHLADVRAARIAAAGTLLGRPLGDVYEYTITQHGIGLALTAEEARRLAALDGVVAVEWMPDRHLDTFRSPQFIGADRVWTGTAAPGLPGTRGEGMVIGVIDTGINCDHPSFGPLPAECGARGGQPKLLAAYTCLSAQGGDIDPFVQARLHEGQAMTLELAGRHQAALDQLDRAIALVERAPADAQQVGTLSRLLTTKVRAGTRHGLLPVEEARALAERAVALGARRGGRPATTVEERAQAQAALVDVHIRSGDFAAAEAESLSMRARLQRAGQLGRHLLLDTLIAGHRLVLGETQAMLDEYPRLLQRWVHQYGPDFRTVASVNAQYAEALERAGRFDEAVAATREARRIARRAPTDSLDVIGLDRFLARRLLRAGHGGEAEGVAAALDAELAGRTQPDALGTRVQTLVLLADIALDRGDVQAAAAFQEQARSLLASVPAQHPFHARAARAVQRLQAELCLWQGDAACAAAEAEAAIATARDLREDPTELVQARLLHLNAVRALGDRARAEVLAAGYRDETVAFAGPCSTYTLALRAAPGVPTLRALSASTAGSCAP